jgi:large subunit ribosomal protein L22
MATEYRASHRFARTAPRKARLVADMIRGMPVNRALVVLDHSPQRAAVLVGKVVRSAVANAEQDTNVDPNHLRVSLARVDEGPLLGGAARWRAGSRGRAMPIKKRTSHIYIQLGAVLATHASGKAAPTEATAPEDGKPGAGKPGAGKAGGGKAAGARTKAKATAAPRTPASKPAKKKKEG